MAKSRVSDSELQALDQGSPVPRDSLQPDSRFFSGSYPNEAEQCLPLTEVTSLSKKKTAFRWRCFLSGFEDSPSRSVLCAVKLVSIVVAVVALVSMLGYLTLVVTSTSVDYWAVFALDSIRQNAWALDSRLAKCFDEIPKVPEMWGANVPSCPVGNAPPDSFPDHTKRVAVVQYQWALNAKPFSTECAAYAEATYEGTSFYCSLGLWRTCDPLDFGPRPDPQKWANWNLTDLPRISPVLGKRGWPTRPHPASPPPTSVLLSLYDALGRGTYQRFVAPAVLAAVGEDFEVFDFTRFNVVGCCSNRNTRAMYGGVVAAPEIAASIRTGVPTPPEDVDADICLTSDVTELRATCQRHMLYGRYFERGYLPVGLEPRGVGEYFQTCIDRCANLTGLAVTGQEFAHKIPVTMVGAVDSAQKLAAAFHSLASKTTAIFATDHNDWAHNGHMNVHNSAYAMSALIRSVRKSAHQRGIPLPLLMFFADHGLHFGDAVEGSILGKMERKFPTLVILAPKGLLAANPDLRTNLQRNRQRLVSAFDLHRTLAEFADSQASRGMTRGKRSRSEWTSPQLAEKPGKQVNARNFFQSEIPLGRDCADAGIEDRMCACSGWTFVRHTEEGALAAAETALSAVNKMTRTALRDTKCSTDLRLIRIKTVRRSPPKDSKSLVELVLAVSAEHVQSLFSFKKRMIMIIVTLSCSGEVDGLHLAGTSCSLVTFERLSSLSPEEDAMYKGSTSGLGDGKYVFKLCVIN